MVRLQAARGIPPPHRRHDVANGRVSKPPSGAVAGTASNQIPLGPRRAFRGSLPTDDPPQRAAPGRPSPRKPMRGAGRSAPRGGDRSAKQITGGNMVPLVNRRKPPGTSSMSDDRAAPLGARPPPPRSSRPRTPPPRSARELSHEPRHHGPPKAPLGTFSDKPHRRPHEPRNHGMPKTYPPNYPIAHQASPRTAGPSRPAPRPVMERPPYRSPPPPRSQRAPSHEPRDHHSPQKLNSFSSRPMMTTLLNERAPIPDGTQADRRSLNQGAVNFILNSVKSPTLKVNPYSVVAMQHSLDERRRQEAHRGPSPPPARRPRTPPPKRRDSPPPRKRHDSPPRRHERTRTPPPPMSSNGHRDRLPKRHASPEPRRKSPPPPVARRAPSPPPVRRHDTPPRRRDSPPQRKHDSPPPKRHYDGDHHRRSSPGDKRAPPPSRSQRRSPPPASRSLENETRRQRSPAPRHERRAVESRSDPSSSRRQPEVKESRRRSPSTEKRTDRAEERREEKVTKRVESPVNKETERRARTPSPAVEPEVADRSPSPTVRPASSKTASPVYELDDLDAMLGMDDSEAMMPLHTVVATPEPNEESADSDVELDYEEEALVDAEIVQEKEAESSDDDEQLLREKLLEKRRAPSVESSEPTVRRSPEPEQRARSPVEKLVERRRQRSPEERDRRRAVHSSSSSSRSRTSSNNRTRDEQSRHRRPPSPRDRRHEERHRRDPPTSRVRPPPPPERRPLPPPHDSGKQYSFPSEREAKLPSRGREAPSSSWAPRAFTPPPVVRRARSPLPVRRDDRAPPARRHDSPPLRRRSPEYRRQPTGRIQPAMLERKYSESRDKLTESMRTGVRHSLETGGPKVSKRALDVLMPRRQEIVRSRSPKNKSDDRQRQDSRTSSRTEDRHDDRAEQRDSPPPRDKRPSESEKAVVREQSPVIAESQSQEEEASAPQPHAKVDPVESETTDKTDALEDYEEMVGKDVPDVKSPPKRERICFDLNTEEDPDENKRRSLPEAGPSAKRARRSSPPPRNQTRRIVSAGRRDDRPSAVSVSAGSQRSVSYGKPREVVRSTVSPRLGRPPITRRVVINDNEDRK